MTGSAPVVDLPLPEGKSFDVVGLGVHHLFLLPAFPEPDSKVGAVQPRPERSWPGPARACRPDRTAACLRARGRRPRLTEAERGE